MIKNDIEEQLQHLIMKLGYELWGCDYLAQGRHSLLRIYIDKHDGIRIEDCEHVTREVTFFLDRVNPIPGNYNLEVSSPGISRPLFKKEQYKRYAGRRVKLKLFKPIEGKRLLTGTIINANDATLLLNVEKNQLEILFSQIAKANLL